MIASARPLAAMLLRRHRWGLGSVAIGSIGLVLAVAVAPAVTVNGIGLAAVLLVLSACYLVGVFALGFDTDVAAAGSCYPPRLFALPVSTTALAAWPALFGVTALSLFWVAAVSLVLRPWGVNVPLAWPGLVIAAQYVWLLAILWWPFGLSWVRVIVGVLIGHIPASVTIYARNVGWPIFDLIAFLNGAIVTGSTLAYIGVRRARSGTAFKWNWLPTLAVRSSAVMRPPFRSIAQAQAWFEWRRHGSALPTIMLFMVPLCLLPFFLDEPTPANVLRNLLLVVVQPVFFAGMAGTSVGKHNAWVRDYYGVPSFNATRPITTAQMVAAMLRGAFRTTLVTWALVTAMVAGGVLLSGSGPAVAEVVQQWVAARSPVERLATLVGAVAALLLVTWKRLVENLFIGLTGREWVIKGAVFVGLFFGGSCVSVAFWLMVTPQYLDGFRVLLPWGLAGLVVGKFALAALAVRALRSRRLVADATLFKLAVSWAVFVGVLTALAVWLVPPVVVEPPTLALTVALSTPLARLSAMLLALDWNRHR